MTQQNKIKVVTGEVRLSYVNAFEARSAAEGQTPKYSTSIIIPKTDKQTISAIQRGIEEAVQRGLPKFNGKRPQSLRTPLRDGDEERADDPAYEGCYFLNCNSRVKPGVVDQNLVAITDPDELYSGCYGRVSLTFYAYNTNGNKGIACGLQNIQKLRDGERLGGRARAEDDFATAQVEDFLD